MKWVLIIWGSIGMTPATADFYDKASCENAGKAVVQEFIRNECPTHPIERGCNYGMIDNTWQFVCVPKGQSNIEGGG